MINIPGLFSLGMSYPSKTLRQVSGRFVPNEFLHALNRKRLTEVVLGDYAEPELTVLLKERKLENLEKILDGL